MLENVSSMPVNQAMIGVWTLTMFGLCRGLVGLCLCLGLTACQVGLGWPGSSIDGSGSGSQSPLQVGNSAAEQSLPVPVPQATAATTGTDASAPLATDARPAPVTMAPSANPAPATSAATCSVVSAADLGLSVQSLGDTWATIRWSHPADASGLSYRVSLNGEMLQEAYALNALTLQALTPERHYTFSLQIQQDGCNLEPQELAFDTLASGARTSGGGSSTPDDGLDAEIIFDS